MNEFLWYVSRATGSVGIVLMTAVLVLGLVAFLGVHIVTAVVETYVDIGWLSTVVPFTSGYTTWQVRPAVCCAQ